MLLLQHRVKGLDILLKGNSTDFTHQSLVLCLSYHPPAEHWTPPILNDCHLGYVAEGEGPLN